MTTKSDIVVSSTTEGVGPKRPLFVSVLAIVVAIGGVAFWVYAIYMGMKPEGNLTYGFLGGLLVCALGFMLAIGLWKLQNWARAGVILLLLIIGFWFAVQVMFQVSAQIFGGEQVVPFLDILKYSTIGLLRILATGTVPLALIYGLARYGPEFNETTRERETVDRGVLLFLIAAAFSSIVIVFLIIIFVGQSSLESVAAVGILPMVFGTVWRPGSIIGAEGAQLGMFPMILGTILSTFGAVVLGVVPAIGAAILLAEVAPHAVREVFRPAIELLAGIPSVVYGLFGMVVLAPLIRQIPVSNAAPPGNTGFGLLNASIILAIMILPTVTNIAEDAIRAVPKTYKEGSLAMGATHWQTISKVMLPAARSGIVAAIILGIGRALGETMALIMVIGNSIAMPKPLNANPLTLFLNTARTLTGNIAVEINYATGVHRSALFFSGVLLFVMIIAVNSLARYIMKERV